MRVRFIEPGTIIIAIDVGIGVVDNIGKGHTIELYLMQLST